jgi:hypothetical protein
VGRSPATVSINQFAPRKFEDFEIVDDDNRRVGFIRVKPSGILWAPKGSQKWFGVSLKTFADYMEENGKQQTK